MGSTEGVITDVDGLYSIRVTPQSQLEVSYLGYQSQTVAVGARTIIDVMLESDTKVIDDVVVIGYGSTTKKELTGSVSSIKADELNRGTFSDAMGMLQGKVAGLSIVNPNGANPDGDYEILLRGTNTLSAGQGPLLIIDGVAGADIQNINFQEIESIDVLKDGSAAAIYGTRGTNGVIIITTKRAKAGTTEVVYDGQTTVGTVASRAMPMSTEEYISTINTYRPELSSYIYDGDTDWFDEITQTPVSHKHNLSISGGSKEFSHHTSLNYENTDGLQRNNSTEKMMARINIRQDLLEGWLNLDYNLNLVHRKSNPANTSAFTQAFTHNPTEPVYDDSNPDAGGYSLTSAMEYYNPVAMVDEYSAEKISDNYGANIRATINILPIEGLKWDNFVSLSRQNYESRKYYSRYYPSLIGTDGQASIENYIESDKQFESTLNYVTSFDKHSIQGLLGYTYQYSYYTSAYMCNTGYDFDNNLTNNIGSGTGLQAGTADMTSYKEDNTYIGAFARFMYNYDDKYLLSASIRRDGSSRFGDDNKWGWFPAVSAGWRVSKEEFMSDATWITDLKVRAGVGVTGNQDFSSYKSLMVMATSGQFYYNGEWINTYAPASNANPDLQWEKKTETNIGVDMAVLDNRLSFTVDYYKRVTSDLLYDYSVPTPPYVYSTLFTNVGTVSNQGIELAIFATPYLRKNFKWNTSFTASRNTNMLDKFTNDEFTNGTYKVGWSSGAAAYTQRLIEGQSLGTFYGPVYLGTDTNGEDILKNQDADGSVNEDDWEVIGCAYPDVQLGWSNTFTYKNFDLNFSLRASIGGDVLNSYAMEYENLSSIGIRNIAANWLEQTDYTSTTYKYSSKYIEDASYLKLDNISIGYQWRFVDSLIKGLKLSATVQNVWCITGYTGVDPEVSLTGLAPGIESMSYYPTTTNFTLGVKVNF